MIETKTGIVIDKLTTEFNQSVLSMGSDSEKFREMQKLLVQFNPRYMPIDTNTGLVKADVLSQVVAGIYAPLIHGFSLTVLKNITLGNLSPVIIAPPRDAIPLAVSLQKLADIQSVDIEIIMPYVNRNIAGIENNQKKGLPQKDPLLDLHFDQVSASINGKSAMGVVEVETGIYGTTSLVMAEEFKMRGVASYTPLKFYGLGPNLSFAHAILSHGTTWNAENASEMNLVTSQEEHELMVLLDTMEELGMEKAYKSVEQLTYDENGLVVPVIETVSDEDYEVYRSTNTIIDSTACQYSDLAPEEIETMLLNIGWLVQISRQGFPFTLTSSIPSMDSKETHFAKIRNSNVFDYPNLII